MGLFDELNAGVNSAMQACKNGSEKIKLRAKVTEQEKLINKMTDQIGNLILIELDNGKEFSPAIMERYEVIKAARSIIAEAKAEKPEGVKICPACGKKTVSDMEYCGYCGTRLADEVQMNPDEAEDNKDNDKEE